MVAARALVIVGAPGSGKSTVLDKLGTLLEIGEVRFGAVECDELARGGPNPSLLEVLSRLAAVTALQHEAGRDLLVVAATPENDRELDQVVGAIGADRTLVVCLSAPGEVVAARVAAREPDEWPGKEALVGRSSDLALAIPRLRRVDVVLDSSDRGAAHVARELHALLRRWLEA